MLQNTGDVIKLYEVCDQQNRSYVAFHSIYIKFQIMILQHRWKLRHKHLLQFVFTFTMDDIYPYELLAPVLMI